LNTGILGCRAEHVGFGVKSEGFIIQDNTNGTP